MTVAKIACLPPCTYVHHFLFVDVFPCSLYFVINIMYIVGESSGTPATTSNESGEPVAPKQLSHSDCNYWLSSLYLMWSDHEILCSNKWINDSIVYAAQSSLVCRALSVGKIYLFVLSHLEKDTFKYSTLMAVT